MPVRKGSAAIAAIRKGSATIAKVYKGAALVVNLIGAGVWTTIRTRLLAVNSDSWANFTLRERINAAGLADVAGTKMRFTLSASTEQSLTIQEIWVGNNSGSGFDYVGSPTQLFFGGSATVTIPANTSAVCEADFAYNGSGALVVGMYVPNNTASDAFRRATRDNTDVGYKSGNDAATTGAVTGYNTSGSAQDLFAVVEVLAPS